MKDTDLRIGAMTFTYVYCLLILFTVLTSSAAAETTGGHFGCNVDELGLSLLDIAALSDLRREEVAGSSILAYFAERHPRPVVVEGVLTAVRSSLGQWILFHARRSDMNREWALYRVYDVDVKGSQLFDGVPSEDDVDEFLRDTEWTWKPDTDFRLMRTAICKGAWESALGFSPKHSFIK